MNKQSYGPRIGNKGVLEHRQKRRYRTKAQGMPHTSSRWWLLTSLVLQSGTVFKVTILLPMRLYCQSKVGLLDVEQL